MLGVGKGARPKGGKSKGKGKAQAARIPAPIDTSESPPEVSSLAVSPAKSAHELVPPKQTLKQAMGHRYAGIPQTIPEPRTKSRGHLQIRLQRRHHVMRNEYRSG